MPDVPFWFIGMAVVCLSFGLKFVVDLKKLQRRPPIEVDISRAVEAVAQKFEAQVAALREEQHRAAHEQHQSMEAVYAKISSSRRGMEERIETVRAELADSNKVAAHNMQQVLEKIGELRGEIRQLVGRA